MTGIPARSTTLGVVFLVLFADLVGFSIVFPLGAQMLQYYQSETTGLMPVIVHALKHLAPKANDFQIGALFGGVLAAVYSSIQFVVSPWWGRLSDRYGRRPILLLSILGTTSAYCLWIFADSFALLLVSRVIAGFMTGNVSVANAAASDITTQERRARAMGLIGMAFGLGFILGPAIGGGSYWLQGTIVAHAGSHPLLAWLVSPTPFSLPAEIACALSLCNLLWAFTRFRETLPPERRTTAASEAGRTINPAQIFSGTLGPGVGVINGAFMLHTLLFAGMEATLVFLTAQCLGFQPQHNGMLFIWMGFLSALAQGGIFRRFIGKVGPKPLAVAGLVVVIPGFLGIALVNHLHSAVLLFAATGVLAVGTGLVFPGLNAMASLAGDPRRQGWVLGTFRSAGSLGRAVGPLLGALAYFLIAPAAPYLVSALGMIVPVLLIVRLRYQVAAPA